MRITLMATGISGAARMAKAVFLFWLILASVPSWPASPDLDFRAPQAAGDAAMGAVMRDLAERLLPVYQEPDPDRYLANLSALQMVAGDYGAADVSRQSLRDRRRSADLARPVSRAAIYDIYAYAKAMEAEDKISFSQAFAKSFREVVTRLNDQDAYAVTRWLGISPQVFRDALQKLLDQQRAKDSIDQSDAIELLRAYLSFDAYRAFGPLVDSLNAEDDRRRYTADDAVLIKTSDGASIAAVVVRPKGASKPLPTLLEITLDDSQNYAEECAAHGYVGVVAYTRGAHASPHRVVPYQHDADDARAVINWIAMQSWSDGRVGMYGDGYSAFTPWAAATRIPPALKAIAASAPHAPGIDVPMEGSIFQNSAYRWSLYVTNTQPSIEESYGDEAVWRALDQKWYRSGRRYRDMGRVHRQPNPIFIRWLNHPSYDRYWQKMLPYQEQFAKINIPVLTTTGYFAESEPGALYLFTQHLRYNPQADHTLLIGPYDDSVMRHGASAALHGYPLDSAALVDLRDVRYRWFDHIFKGGAMPGLLKDRINYELMGANEWRHAPTLEAIASGSQRFYLDAAASGENQRLTRRKNSNSSVLQTVNFADRTDAAWVPPTELITKQVVPHNGVMFMSEPLTKTTEFNGLLSGRLDFTVNKMDMDLYIMLYERLAGGDYVRLSNTYEFRASYARDRAHRHLLKAGERQQLVFKSEQVTSRQLQAGSRLVMVLGINKRPDREINYGTGNDVSEESIADGKIPLKIRWHGDSYIEIPIRK
ncbi:MAG TPA: CocE/NonD family hydrolase [Steroidobacteraceae bacterium]|nr:CocE/NonD family hydrolase [Steroidobacteraceae bacterium]